MAILSPSTPFDSVKRKFAKTDQIHFRNRKADNATISVRMKHPYDGGSSASQLAQRAKFRQAQTATATALATPETRATYEASYKKQHKYITLRGYVFAEEYKKLA